MSTGIIDFLVARTLLLKMTTVIAIITIKAAHNFLCASHVSGSVLSILYAYKNTYLVDVTFYSFYFEIYLPQMFTQNLVDECS